VIERQCPTHRCSLAECAMWVEVSGLPDTCNHTKAFFTYKGRFEFEMLPSPDPYVRRYKSSFTIQGMAEETP
jgi:hypothetical protein